MMGIHPSQEEIFAVSVDLDRRVRPGHGASGNVSVDPVVLATDRMHRANERGFTTNDTNHTNEGDGPVVKSLWMHSCPFVEFVVQGLNGRLSW